MKDFFKVPHLKDLQSALRIQCKAFGPEWWFIPLVTYYKGKDLYGFFLMGHGDSTIETLRKIELKVNPEEWYRKDKK